MLWRHWQEQPELIKFIIRHFAIGVVLGWASALMMIWYDVGAIGSLLARYDSAALTALFFAKGGLYFGTLAMSVAVMNMGSDGVGGPRRRLLPVTRFDVFRDSRADRPVKSRRVSQPVTAEFSSVPRSLGRHWG